MTAGPPPAVTVSNPGRGTRNMPPALTFFSRSGWPPPAGDRHRLGMGVLVLLHLAALAVLLRTEDDLVPRLAFVLTWGFSTSSGCCVLRRPPVAASLSLVLVVILILLSQLQAGHPDHERQFRRRHADRRRHRFVPADDLSRPRCDGRGGCGRRAAAARAVLVARSFSRAVARLRCSARSVCLAALERAVARGADGSRRRRSTATNYVSQFARSGVHRACSISRRAALWNPTAP